MDEAEESEIEISTMMAKLDKEVNRLESKMKKNESKARKRISNLVEMADLMIESYRLEFGKLNDSTQSKSKKFHSELNQIKENVEQIIN